MGIPAQLIAVALYQTISAYTSPPQLRDLLERMDVRNLQDTGCVWHNRWVHRVFSIS